MDEGIVRAIHPLPLAWALFGATTLSSARPNRARQPVEKRRLEPPFSSVMTSPRSGAARRAWLPASITPR